MRTNMLFASIGLVLCLVSNDSSVAAFQSPVLTPTIMPTATVPPSPIVLASGGRQLEPIVTIGGDIVRSLAAAATVVIALVGLNKWRAELRTRTRLELARRMVKLAYTLRDQFEHARSMFTFAGESAGRTRDPSERPDETLILDEHYVRSTRVDLMGKTLLELREATWEAEVVFGQDIHELITPIEEAYRKLAIAIRTLFSLQLVDVRNPIHQQPPRSRDDLIEASRKIVYGMTSDEFSQSLHTSVAALVEKLKDEIRR